MYRKLIVMRHAKTEEANWDQTDYERKLTERGRTDAAKMATRLKNQFFHPQKIIASSAVRTSQTAVIVASVLETEINQISLNENLYMCSLQKLNQTLCEIDNVVETCMIIGHNPSISEFIFDLNPKAISSALPTAGVVVFNFEGSSWKDIYLNTPNIELVDYPKRQI